MKINIDQPIGLNERGKRENNEDACYPALEKAGTNNSLFIVCDGVGGAAKGEVASNTVCTAIPGYFLDNKVLASDKEDIERSVEHAERLIDNYLEKNPEAHGMGTTLSLLHLHSKGATIAWCGDSRVYQIRGNKIIFKTTDHSLVNDMVKAGVIKPEEAIDHPKKNVITRAIQGKSIKKAKVDVVILDDIRKGDKFFLCTDGILEAFNDDQLLKILADEGDLQSKTDAIQKTCHANSNDNYTCYLIRVNKVTGKSKSVQSIPVAAVFEAEKPPPKPEEPATGSTKDLKQRRRRINVKNKVFLFVILFSIIASLSLLFLIPGTHKEPPAKEPVQEAILVEPEKSKPPGTQPRDENNIAGIQTEEQTPDAPAQPDTATEMQLNSYVDKRDNNSYILVTIGDTEWFARNLNYQLEGSLDQELENGGRYYTWEQARQACPDGWYLPSSKLYSVLRTTEMEILELVFSGHYRKGTNSDTDKAMFWFAERDKDDKPQFFSLKKGDEKLQILKGEPETFKPVRCVRVIEMPDGIME